MEKARPADDELNRAAQGRWRGQGALVMGALLHGIHAGVVLVSSLLFFAGMPVRAWSLIPAVLIAVGVVMGIARGIGLRLGEMLRYCGIAMMVAAACFVAASLVYDTSYDGQWYHQEAAIQVSRGWVPGTALTNADVPIEDARWRIVHFPHASAIAESAVYRLTGAIEAAKGWNATLMFASACLAFALMRSLTHSTAPLAALVAAGAALSPVATAQWMTFYVDGVTSALILSFLSLCVLWARRVMQSVSLLALIVLLGSVLIATKPTAVIPVALAFGCVFVSRFVLGMATARARDKGAIVFTATITFLLGVGVCGFSPYVTNTLRFGHPFHPLVGPNAIGFDWRPSRPADFNDVGRVARLARSTFSWPQNSMTDARFDASRLKFPLQISLHRDGWTTFGFPDTRVAGFGPWYALGIVGAALLLLLIARPHRKASIGAAIVIALLYGSALLNPEAWWARYSPQLWLVPFVALVTVGGVPVSRSVERLAVGVAAVLLINAILVAGVAVESQLGKSRAVAQELRAVPRDVEVLVDFGPFRSNRVRLTEAGIRFREATFADSEAVEVPEMKMRIVNPTR